jgi:hypothetical protein
MLRIAATLETFKCDGCSLLLPPQSMFSTPEKNPRRIQELFQHGVLKLSAAELTSNTAREVAALLPLYPALKQLDVSANPGLRCSGAAVILSALAGKPLFASHSLLRCVPCDCCCAGPGAAALEVVNLSGAGLVDDEAPALAEQLGKFPALKQLDVSANPGLRLLPVGMLRIVATLETFKCDGCSLLLPPQSMFSTPEKNPRRIQELLSKGSSATVLKLSAAELTSNTAREVAALLPLYPALKQLDVSANPGLELGSVSLIFKALSGKTRSMSPASSPHFHFHLFLLLLHISTFPFPFPPLSLLFRSPPVCRTQPRRHRRRQLAR